MNNDVAILEIRGATGGDEAKIWANDLVRMYSRYALSKGWTVQSLDDAVIRIKGLNAFSQLQYEGGVHRVQRIPNTERYGRIHTSTATVAVLPEIADNQIYINPSELEWDFYRSGGHGGQNVNKVSTAVRLRHKPTGMVVTASQERFQEQNRRIALNLLRSKLWEIEEEKRLVEIGGARSAIGRGMRSEKIRTYNFPQNRLTDHRINKSWHNLEDIMNGKLDKVLTTLLSTVV
ncbi:PCRF domain-containing protein [Candidatus Gottesmanbacteria bacterium]|nr:PCRF domain-containing protein [Candidatus Gottesmanbacteria bacterium]